MLQNTKARKMSYSLKTMADFKGLVLESCFEGMQMKINGSYVFTRLVGDYNASNILAIYGAASLLGMDDEEILLGISKLHGAPGRFQVVRSNSGIIGIVDYAHTPDALKTYLQPSTRYVPIMRCLSRWQVPEVIVILQNALRWLMWL